LLPIQSPVTGKRCDPIVGRKPTPWAVFLI
jgi:hypothetical protein